MNFSKIGAKSITRVIPQILSYHCTLFTVDGGWGSWTGISQCSASCGGGKKVRTRRCDNPVPRSGGLECQGRNSDALDCNAVPCKGKSKIYVDFTLFLICIIIFLDHSNMFFFHLQMPCQGSHFIRKKRLVATVFLRRTFGLVIEDLRKNALRCAAIVWSVQHSFTRKMGGAVFPTSVH